MAKSGWTDEDEKALLDLLQKKWHGGNSGSGYAAGSSILTPLESQGAMTDGSKRLREALDDDEFDVISSAAEPLSAQLPVMTIPIFPGIADKVLDQLTADLVPEGMSFRDWSRTKFAFGKFANEGKTYREVYVDDEMAGYCKWSMDHQSLQELDLEQGFKGMQEEVRNLEHCKTGRIITQSELDDMKKAVPNLRLIQSRWVAAYKSSERVLTRIFAKDFNRGSSARSLGFSSPTPSIESVHLVLAMAATRKMLLRALDVSHAFMHSPLGTGVHVVLKMPLSISFPSGEATYYLLEKALNGLRDASLAWLQLLTFTVEHVGLWSDSLEPCVYGGQIVKDGHEIGFCLCVVYVDDILLLSTTKEAEEHVVATLSSVVPVKTTGEIGEEGGSLTFIGRVIKRERDSSEITLGVDPHYLDSTFLDYGVTRGSENVPDISGHLEKTLTDSNFQKPLSDEAYSRFRKALGKLLWLSQVRHDLKTWMSALGTQQAKPMHGTEQALKAVLRFLYVDMHACLFTEQR